MFFIENIKKSNLDVSDLIEKYRLDKRTHELFSDILINLFLLSKSNTGLVISTDRKTSIGCNRDNMVHRLEKLGLVIRISGNNFKGLMTTIFPTQELLDYFEYKNLQMFYVSFCKKDNNNSEAVIRYKDKKGKVIKIDEIADECVNFMNNFMKDKEFSLYIPYDLVFKTSENLLWMKEMKKFEINDSYANISFMPVKYQRIFQENLSSGGRFYTGLQQMPSTLRNNLKLCLEDTVELDFSGMQIRQLYAKNGILDYQKDPYANPYVERDYAKIIMNSLLNGKSLNNTDFRIKTDLGINISIGMEILNWFFEEHKQIVNYFHSVCWTWTQMEESRILEIISYMAIQENIPFLAIHDSFIIRRKDKEAMKAIMNYAHEQILNTEGIIKEK